MTVPEESLEAQEPLEPEGSEAPRELDPEVAARRQQRELRVLRKAGLR